MQQQQHSVLYLMPVRSIIKSNRKNTDPSSTYLHTHKVRERYEIPWDSYLDKAIAEKSTIILYTMEWKLLQPITPTLRTAYRFISNLYPIQSLTTASGSRLSGSVVKHWTLPRLCYALPMLKFIFAGLILLMELNSCIIYKTSICEYAVASCHFLTISVCSSVFLYRKLRNCICMQIFLYFIKPGSSIVYALAY